MPRLSPSGRWLLLAVAGAVLLAVLVGLASQHSPGHASTPSPSATALVQGSPILPGSFVGFTPNESPAAPSGRQETASGLASPMPTSAPAGWLTLDALLARLPVASEHRAGYDRALFPHWIDADGDGCNTRYEVLIDEAVVAPSVGPGCSLSGGTWRSLYDGLVTNDPADLQIDHLVALAEAWDSGAYAWSTDRRELFANDLDVSWALFAVSSASNQSKSDKDPADWVPPDPNALCPFVSAWIADKARWGLSVDQREESVLAGLIRECPGARMPLVPAPAASPAGPPATSLPGGSCSAAYPTVCIPPPPPDLNCADITFRRFVVLPPDPHHFDGDGDGIGCESG
jgi:hypothetical protein